MHAFAVLHLQTSQVKASRGDSQKWSSEQDVSGLGPPAGQAKESHSHGAQSSPDPWGLRVLASLSSENIQGSGLISKNSTESRTPKVSLHKASHCPCDLLVPQSVDKRVEHRSDNQIEESKYLVRVLRGACPRPHIGNGPSPKKEHDHRQVGGTGREVFSTSLRCRDPKDGDKDTGIGGYDQ